MAYEPAPYEQSAYEQAPNEEPAYAGSHYLQVISDGNWTLKVDATR